MADKIYSPKEAALMVLAKAQELYKLSSLSKSEDLKKGEWNKIHAKLEKEGYSKKSADKIDGAIKAKMGKSELKKDEDMGGGMAMGMSEENPDEKADAKLGEEVEKEVENHEEHNEDPKHEMKGHIKLAKFMGRMEHKKSQKSKEMDKAETGYEKGVNVQNQQNRPGMSQAGNDVRHAASKKGGAMGTSSMPASEHIADAKNQHKETLAQIHQMSKPKLPG